MEQTFSKWRPHPWHGLDPGPSPPSIVTVFVEITPFDLVKYEVDKASGYLKVDRAQRTSSLPPSIYGFIPQTYAGRSVAALMPGSTGGDRDPLDICVLSERPITRDQVPGALIDRLVHYFSTYKIPPSESHEVAVGEPYGRSHAEAVIEAAMADYEETFPGT